MHLRVLQRKTKEVSQIGWMKSWLSGFIGSFFKGLKLIVDKLMKSFLGLHNIKLHGKRLKVGLLKGNSISRLYWMNVRKWIKSKQQQHQLGYKLRELLIDLGLTTFILIRWLAQTTFHSRLQSSTKFSSLVAFPIIRSKMSRYISNWLTKWIFLFHKIAQFSIQNKLHNINSQSSADERKLFN